MHASIAERLAYGTPIERGIDDARIQTVPRSGTALLGRVLLGALFVASGIPKLTEPGAAVGSMTGVGIANADVLVYVAGFAEVLGGAALIFGFLARLGALGLVLFLIPTTYLFHAFWGLDGAERQMQMAHFMKNLAIMGGLLAIVAHGPGRYSVDARLRYPLTP